MEEKPNYYAIIPANVRYDNELKPIEKLLYGEITTLTLKTGECWASNNYFSQLYNICPTTISKYLNHLKQKGYLNIEIKYFENTKQIEKRIISIVQNNNTLCSYEQEGYCSYEQEGIAHTSKGKNTSIKNTSINNKEIYKESCKRVIDRLNELNNTKYSATSKSTLSFIKARLEEGYTEDDLLLVVEKMSYLWNQPNDKDMRQYLRPSTLFRPTNFENYLNMPVTEKKLTTRDLASKMDFTDFLEKGRIK